MRIARMILPLLLLFSCSVTSDSLQPHGLQHVSLPSQILLKLMSIEPVMSSNYLILCCPLFTCLHSFQHQGALHIRWPKYWSFSFRISPSNEYSGLISFRIDWFDLFAVQGTLKSLLRTSQFKNINSSVLSLRYGPTLIPILDYWKNHSFDHLDLCQQSNVSALSAPI